MKKKNIITSNTSFPKPVGIYSMDEDVYLFYRNKTSDAAMLGYEKSTDCVRFTEGSRVDIRNKSSQRPDVTSIYRMRISRTDDGFLSSFKYRTKTKESLYVASSKDLSNWLITSKIHSNGTSAVIVPEFKHKGNLLMYIGGVDIKLAIGKDPAGWKVDKNPVFTSNFSKESIDVVFSKILERGILVLFFQKVRSEHDFKSFALFGVIFDKDDPRKIIWRSEYSLFEEPETWSNYNIPVFSVGAIEMQGKMVSFWEIEGRELFAIFHQSAKEQSDLDATKSFTVLKKFSKNPILKPVIEHYWESKAVFNPAAVYEENKVHLVYRAIGDQDVSLLGYASSSDGKNIDERLDDPIYIPTQDFEFKPSNPSAPFVSPYMSGGGGSGGCEDPRLTKIGDKYYMTYVAYDGCSPPRVAMTKISSKDFHSKKWNFDKPVLISPPGVVDKNCVIFPEKINGKYAVMHRIFPNILLDYVDSLDDFDGSSFFLRGEYKIKPKVLSWDSRKVGAGAPPIKTEAGWLLVYHAVGDSDPGRYKMGAMLLDLADPTKEIARTYKPMLEPNMPYENEGMKYGVAYPCGAVVVNGELLVYYGGADMVTCVASAKLDTLLDQLTSSRLSERQQIFIENKII